MQQQRRAGAEQGRQTQGLGQLSAQPGLQGPTGRFGNRKPLKARPAAGQLQAQQPFGSQPGQQIDLPVGIGPEQHVEKLRQAAVTYAQGGIDAAQLQ